MKLTLNHFSLLAVSTNILTRLNSLQGEKDCPYYMCNGSCKYESNCWFNHPDPTTVGGGDTLSGCGNAGSGPSQGAFQSAVFSQSQPRTANETVPFVPVVFSPTHNVPPPNVGCNGYQVHPVPDPTN